MTIQKKIILLITLFCVLFFTFLLSLLISIPSAFAVSQYGRSYVDISLSYDGFYGLENLKNKETYSDTDFPGLIFSATSGDTKIEADKCYCILSDSVSSYNDIKKTYISSLEGLQGYINNNFDNWKSNNSNCYYFKLDSSLFKYAEPLAAECFIDIIPEVLDYSYCFFVSVEQQNDIGGTSVATGTLKYFSGNVITSLSNCIQFSSGRNEIIDYLENKTPKNSDYLSLKPIYTRYADILGYDVSGDATVSVKYLEMKNYSDFSEKIFSFSIPKFLISNKNYIWNEVCLLKGFDDISYFNLSFSNYLCLINGEKNLLNEKIIRQAKGYSYDYDFCSGIGSLNIEYEDFEYKDLCLRVTNNDLTNNLTIDIYTTTVSTLNNYYIISFDIKSIQEQLLNTCGWLFNLTSENITVKNKKDTVLVEINDNNLTVSFKKDSSNDLFGLSLFAVADIVPDKDINFSYSYIKLDDSLETTLLTSSTEKIKYSDLLKLNSENFYKKYNQNINAAISPDSLKNEKFYIYDGIESYIDYDNNTAQFKVLYSYNTLIKCLNNINNDISYFTLKTNSLSFNYTDLGFVLPTNYRVTNIFLSDTQTSLIDIVFLEENPYNSSFTLKTDVHQNLIIELNFNLSDSYICNFNYFKQYNKTPFFVKCCDKKTINVSDISNIYQITKEQVLSILELETLDLLNLSTIESISVKFDGAVSYDIDFSYTPASLKSTDYSGDSDEVKVYLTSYVEWTNSFGKDWSILMLNDTTSKYFKYSNDVEKDKLYGFFSVAIFKERVTDLSYYFQQYSANGCKTVFTSNKVVGTELYKFCSDHFGAVGKVIMAFDELFNSSDAIYYSYFFYLDGTSDLNYLAINGADNYDDNSSGFINKFEDIGKSINTV